MRAILAPNARSSYESVMTVAPGSTWLIAGSMTVLLLTDENAQENPAGAYFISRALNPAPEQAGGIRVITKRAATTTDGDLRAADAVVPPRSSFTPPS